jgi:hypothetical protein
MNPLGFSMEPKRRDIRAPLLRENGFNQFFHRRVYAGWV